MTKGTAIKTKWATNGRPTALVEGQDLDQPTFHALYEAMPSGTRAELIDGVVFMPSPVGGQHGRVHHSVDMWLGCFAEHTPGVEVLLGSTAILGWKSEPQPDAMLRVLPAHGGQSRDERGYVTAAPELVAEIAKATRFIDLGPKRKDYERTACSSMWCVPWIPTRSTGSAGFGVHWCGATRETMDFTGQRYFLVSGSIPSPS